MLASAVHKSIRRGHAQAARQYAADLLSTQPSYLSYRLGTIALEEIGPGDWTLVGEVLQKIRTRKFDALPDAAARLAEAVKSRSVVYAKPREPSPTLDLFTQSAVDGLNTAFLPPPPPALKFIAEYGRGFERLGYGVPVVWHMMENAETEIVVNEPDLPGDELIEQYPAATYDQHTRDGKHAIAYFAKAVRSPFTVEQIAWGVFVVEGQFIGSRELVFDGSTALRIESIEAGFHNRGIVSRDQMLDLVELVRQNRPQLNDIRRRVLAHK